MSVTINPAENSFGVGTMVFRCDMCDAKHNMMLNHDVNILRVREHTAWHYSPAETAGRKWATNGTADICDRCLRFLQIPTPTGQFTLAQKLFSPDLVKGMREEDMLGIIQMSAADLLKQLAKAEGETGLYLKMSMETIAFGKEK